MQLLLDSPVILSVRQPDENADKTLDPVSVADLNMQHPCIAQASHDGLDGLFHRLLPFSDRMTVTMSGPTIGELFSRCPVRSGLKKPRHKLIHGQTSGALRWRHEFDEEPFCPLSRSARLCNRRGVRHRQFPLPGASCPPMLLPAHSALQGLDAESAPNYL